MIAQVTKTVTTTASGWAILDLPGAELIPLHRQVSLVSRCLGWNEKSMAQDLALGNLRADWFEDLALDQLELGEDQRHTGNRAVAIALYAHLERLSWAWGDLVEDVKLSPAMELDSLGVDADTFWGINNDVTEAWEGAKKYFAEVWGLQGIVSKGALAPTSFSLTSPFSNDLYRFPCSAPDHSPIGGHRKVPRWNPQAQ